MFIALFIFFYFVINWISCIQLEVRIINKNFLYFSLYCVTLLVICFFVPYLAPNVNNAHSFIKISLPTTTRLHIERIGVNWSCYLFQMIYKMLFNIYVFVISVRVLTLFILKFKIFIFRHFYTCLRIEH